MPRADLETEKNIFTNKYKTDITDINLSHINIDRHCDFLDKAILKD